MLRKIVIFAGILLSLHNFCFSANFQVAGIGAKALGMGGAFTALADDSSAVYYNQAGLGNVKYNQIAFMYYDLYSEGLIKNTFLGFTAPYSGIGTFALGWYRASVSDDLMLKGFSENIVSACYGANVIYGLNLGIALKFLGAFYGRIKGLGYSVDTSLYYNHDDFIFLGILLQDINNPTIEWDTDLKEKLNSNLRIGIGAKVISFLILSIDVDQLTYERKNFHFGFEVSPFKSQKAKFRGGLIKIYSQGLGYSFGGSLNLSQFKIDYALNKHADLGFSHIFGITYEF